MPLKYLQQKKKQTTKICLWIAGFPLKIVVSILSLQICIIIKMSKLGKVKTVLYYFAGIPLVYELDENLKPIKHYYLADEAQVKAAMDKVANQGKVKK